MSKPKRLHTAAVDVAFAHGDVETLAECSTREGPYFCIREIAEKLDNELGSVARYLNSAKSSINENGVFIATLIGRLEYAQFSEVRADALRGALELALRSHGRLKAYVEAKRALEACEAPKDA